MTEWRITNDDKNALFERAPQNGWKYSSTWARAIRKLAGGKFLSLHNYFHSCATSLPWLPLEQLGKSQRNNTRLILDYLNSIRIVRMGSSNALCCRRAWTHIFSYKVIREFRGNPWISKWEYRCRSKLISTFRVDVRASIHQVKPSLLIAKCQMQNMKQSSPSAVWLCKIRFGARHWNRNENALEIICVLNAPCEAQPWNS